MYGPYIPMRTGSYTATLHLRCIPEQVSLNTVVATCDVVSKDNPDPLCAVQIINPEIDKEGNFQVSLPFRLVETTFGIQFRVIGERGISLRVYRRVEINDNEQEESDMNVKISLLDSEI
jgi:hypothetical protein